MNDFHDDFQHINAMFSQNFIPLFLGLFNDETDLRVRYFSRENENSYHQHSNSCSLVFFYLS
jgi:hypothetical protein